MYLLPGDGKGGFGETQKIELPGAVTGLVAGEINRADGLTDIVVGVTGRDGAQALIFQGPDGALNATPEAIALPADATAMALGQLDDSFEMDLAIAAGKDLIIVSGSDQQLPSSHNQPIDQPATRNPQFDRRSFPFEIKSLALGDFIWDEQHQTDIALLGDDGDIHLLTNPTRLAVGLDDSERSQTVTKRIGDWRMETLSASDMQPATGERLVCAKVSPLATDDLVVVDGLNSQLHILMTDRRTDTGAVLSDFVGPTPSIDLFAEGAPVALLPMRLNADALSDLVVLTDGSRAPSVVMAASDAIITVTTTADDITPGDGSVSLREAITAINAGNDLGDPDISAQNPGTFGPLDTIKFNIGGGGVKTINVGTDASALGIALPRIMKPVIIDGYTQPGSSANTLSNC